MKDIFPPEIIHLSVENHFYKFNKSSRRIYTLAILFLAGIIISLFFIKTNISVQSKGLIRSSSESIKITSPVVAEVTKTIITENKFVSQGDTLVWLDNEKFAERVKHLKKLILQNEDYLNDIRLMFEFKYSYLKTDLYKTVHTQYRQKLAECDLQINLPKIQDASATLFSKLFKNTFPGVL